MENQSLPFDKENFNPQVNWGAILRPETPFEELTSKEKNKRIAAKNRQRVASLTPSTLNPFAPPILGRIDENTFLVQDGNHTSTRPASDYGY